MDPYTQLRVLLDTVFETDLVLDFPTLVEQYAACSDGKWNILFGIKEKKWFADKNESDKDLIFQYLSFELNGPELTFFRNDRPGLKKRRDDLEASFGFHAKESQHCFCLIDANPDIDVDKVFNLTKRIFVFYYKNCGPKKHFLRSISERFVKEFWRDPSQVGDRIYDHEHVASYVRDRVGIDCLFFKQRDEMFLEGNFDLPDVISPMTESSQFEGANAGLLRRLGESKDFRSNLIVSVQKKNIAFGHIDDVSYVISTITSPSFEILDEGGVGNYRKEPDVILVYVVRGENVSLDKVTIAEEIISNFVHLNNVYQTQSAQEQIEQFCSDAEIKLSISPVLYRTDIIHEYRSIIHKIFLEFQNCGLEGDMGLLMFDPFGRSLVPVYNSVDDSLHDESLPIRGKLETPFASVYAFVCGKPFERWHPQKLRSELERSRHFSSETKPELENQRLISGRYSNIRGETGNAVLAMPVVVNHVVVGVVEFSSDDKGGFASEREIIHRISILAGDVLRRLELANDRGWLTRMQFLYAARHKLERVIQGISAVAPDLASELETILGAAKVDKSESDNARVDIKRARKTLLEDMKKKFPGTELGPLSEKLKALNVLESVTRGTLNAIREVFEALASNQKHSLFKANCLSIYAGSYDGSNPPIVMISYKPNEAWERNEIIDQVCVSPISDDNDFTYHYGLFLLASHVRMAGGLAQGMPAIGDETGHAEFGISVILPAA